MCLRWLVDLPSPLTRAFFLIVIYTIPMQVYSNIHCYTKAGPVVWTFFKLNGMYIATNGEDTIVKNTYLELKQIKAKFFTYKTKSGARRFYPGLPKEAGSKQLQLALA